MKNNLNISNHKQYKQGFTFGMMPVFAEFENVDKCGQNFRSQEFINGFTDGRNTYLQLNGPPSMGIPTVILTQSVVENYFALGQIGDDFIAPKFLSTYQFLVASNSYNLGRLEFNSNWNLRLKALLQEIDVYFVV